MQLCVVGTGLIGGSFALGARTRNLFQEFVGVEPDPEHARAALELGIIDEVVSDVPGSADAVLLAGPSDTVAEWVVQLAGHGGVVFDAGSVKAAIVDAVVSRLGAVPDRYVPCHPIAGREFSGPQAADEDLFAERLVIQTPLEHTDAEALEQVRFWWRSLGARVESMDPRGHDEVYAVTSHLPHLLAFVYMQRIEPTHLHHGGGGFRDFSRIAASDPKMWSAIFEMNKDALLAAAREFGADLTAFADAVARDDLDAVEALIARSRARRSEYRGD